MRLTDIDSPIHKGENVDNILKTIADSGLQDEAFYVCDLNDVGKKFKIWNQFLPKIQPFYAIKCNDSIPIIKTMAALGANFDCASKGEIKKVLALGINPSRIIFANPTKPLSHITFAKNVGVEIMTFDNEMELRKTALLFPTSKQVIRIKCDDETIFHKMGKKFGCDHRREAPKLLRIAKELNLEVIGVSFHIGSGNQMKDANTYRTAIGYAFEVFEFAKTLGYNFQLLDIGGGFLGFKNTSIETVSEVINSAIEEYFPDGSVKVIAEPGQFFVASAFTLAVNIHSIKTIENDMKLHYMYYVNEGVFGGFLDVICEKLKLEPKIMNKEKIGKLFSSSIWGPTLDSVDQLVEDMLLPKLNIGDWLYFENMGAYTLTFVMQFNCFPMPSLYFIADENLWSILRETPPFSKEQFLDHGILKSLQYEFEYSGHEKDILMKNQKKIINEL